MNVEQHFLKTLHKLTQPKVLEIGTLRWNPNVSTHHGAWLPHDATYVKTDIGEGIDVDIVSDAHDLAPFKDNEFDVLIAVSVWEHLRKPWIAADACARVLKPGGLLFIATHHTFPVHGYPNDYCRWTDEGLKALFDAPTWTNQMSELKFPCTITPPAGTVWNPAAPAFLNVDLFAIKA